MIQNLILQTNILKIVWLIVSKHHRKCIKNSIENLHTDVRCKGLTFSTQLKIALVIVFLYKLTFTSSWTWIILHVLFFPWKNKIKTELTWNQWNQPPLIYLLNTSMVSRQTTQDNILTIILNPNSLITHGTIFVTCECAVRNPSVIEGQTANILTSQTWLWVWCSASLLGIYKKYLISLSGEMKCHVAPATKYFYKDNSKNWNNYKN